MLGQRYAFDFVRIDDRKGFHLHPAGTLRSYLIGGRTRDCYGWGEAFAVLHHVADQTS